MESTRSEPGPRSSRRMMWVGGLGAGFAGLCCFTPLAVIVLSAVGAGAAVAWLDLVLLPGLLIFLGIFVAGWLRYRRQSAADTSGPAS